MINLSFNLKNVKGSWTTVLTVNWKSALSPPIQNPSVSDVIFALVSHSTDNSFQQRQLGNETRQKLVFRAFFGDVYSWASRNIQCALQTQDNSRAPFLLSVSNTPVCPERRLPRSTAHALHIHRVSSPVGNMPAPFTTGRGDIESQVSCCSIPGNFLVHFIHNGEYLRTDSLWKGRRGSGWGGSYLSEMNMNMLQY